MFARGSNSYGGPEVLHLHLHVLMLPDPHPKLGQVQVKVRMAGINPVDVMVRDGSLAQAYAGVPPPYVPGMDIAGTIDALGDGIDPQLGVAIGRMSSG